MNQFNFKIFFFILITYQLIGKLYNNKGIIMEELNNEELNNESAEFEEEELEFSHTDKLVGIFTEPGNTFEKIAKAPIKATDWVFPVILLFVVLIGSEFIKMSDAQIKYERMEKQIEVTEKSLNAMVESGTLTQEQADQELDNARNRMESMSGGTVLIFTAISIIIGGFLIFFLLAGVYFLFIKFVLKGDGTYSGTLVAYGLPYYIAVLQTIIMVILSLFMHKDFNSLDIATFLSMDKSTFVGMLLGKLDVFTIWFYALISIGFAKIFKSESTTKYYILIFGLWLGFGILFHFLTKAVPFLAMFNR